MSVLNRISCENYVFDSESTRISEVRDVQQEFERLKERLSDGNEKLLDAYFKFLSFTSRHHRQLGELCTASSMKPHFVRLHQEFSEKKDVLRNDERFVQCMMWFAQTNNRLYRDIYELEIGNRHAVTYVLYARLLTRRGKTAEAVAVLRKGLDVEALPISYLEDALKDIQGGSKLQTKDASSMQVLGSMKPELSVCDPYDRFHGEARDFAQDQCRTYDFKSVYPELNPEEFQFEERRLQRWKEKRRVELEKKQLQEKDELIQNLRETVEKLQATIDGLKERLACQSVPMELDGDESEVIEKTHRLSSQSEMNLTRVPSQPPPDANESVTVNRTEMMTRDMRDLFWNGSLESTNVQSTDPTPAEITDEIEQPFKAKMAIFDENGTPQCDQPKLSVFADGENSKRKLEQSPQPAKRFAICTDENQPAPLRAANPAKLKVFDENDDYDPDKDDEDKENVSPKGYQQPPRGSRKTVGILVDAAGFETEPIPQRDAEIDDLGVSPLDDEHAGKSASTPTKNSAPEITWKVTEVLRRGLLADTDSLLDPHQALRVNPVTDRRLSTIMEASKESGSSGSSNSLNTPSMARSLNGTSSSDDSLMQTLCPVVSDPFNPALRNKVILGSKIHYESIEGPLPSMKKKSRLQYPCGFAATVMKPIGEGGYAKVYLANRDVDDESDVQEATTCLAKIDQAAIKVTKEITAGLWEFYILETIGGRLKRSNDLPCITKSIPEPHAAAYYQDGFLISIPYLPYGSLVDVVNKFNKEVPEILVRYLVLELMIIVMRLHEIGIIHGDLKPDNVLFRKIPSTQSIGELRSKTQCLCLIDFGMSIDMQTFPAGTTFSQKAKIDFQRCAAMREDRDWLFDFDWFCVANCAYTLLFGEYIKIEKSPSGDYALTKRLPRYWNPEWWNLFFSSLLNMNAENSRPDHPDNPIKNILQLGGASLNNKDSMRALSLKLYQLGSLNKP